MALGLDLITQFVKATKDTEKKKTETTVYGTAKIQNGVTYAQFDGSDILTPVVTTADVKDGERVTIMLKNHTAVVTGNISSPAARTEDVKNIAEAGVDYKVIKSTVDKLVEDVVNCENDIDNLQKTELELSDTLIKHDTTMTAISLKQINIDNTLLDHEKTMAKVEADILSLQLTNGNQEKSITSIVERLDSIVIEIEGIKSRLDILENPSTE